ncbi:MAG: HD domain-containing protein [Dehalococcoidia bacterium]|nr:HD domain-containing protein [Dehalococcoidia bacterium]HRC61989.1 HD domain-containing protein [Dehalococcoidia bacterium]
MWHSAAYRSGQFFRGFRWALRPDEVSRVCGLLNERERLLFSAMQGRDRRHSMDMVRWLERRGAAKGTPPSADLLAAALLHDVGKGSLIVWDRVAFVLLGACSIRLRRSLERERGWRWQQALWRLEHHAGLGAELLEGSGTRPRVVELVRRHKDPGADGDTELSALMAADGAC